MGRKINLLSSLPVAKRRIDDRAEKKSLECITEAKKFAELYWDGPREYGYGGYSYDGRWQSVAKDIVDCYSLNKRARVLDVGCGKGFLVKDLLDVGIDAYGVDVSEYALINCHDDVVGRLSSGCASRLMFPDDSFDLVISLNTIHNLPRERAIMALREIERVSRSNCFVQVDSYLTQEQKDLFEKWVLTAEYHDFPDGWLETFELAGYCGDYDWTIIE